MTSPDQADTPEYGERVTAYARAATAIANTAEMLRAEGSRIDGTTTYSWTNSLAGARVVAEYPTLQPKGAPGPNDLYTLSVYDPSARLRWALGVTNRPARITIYLLPQAQEQEMNGGWVVSPPDDEGEMVVEASGRGMLCLLQLGGLDSRMASRRPQVTGFMRVARSGYNQRSRRRNH